MGEEAIIHVRRDTGMADGMRAYKVVVDGDSVGKVRRGKTVSIGVAPGHHEVSIKIDWTKSAPIEVELQPGEELKLVCRPNRSALEGPGKAIAKTTVGKDSYIQLVRE